MKLNNEIGIQKANIRYLSTKIGQRKMVKMLFNN